MQNAMRLVTSYKSINLWHYAVTLDHIAQPGIIDFNAPRWCAMVQVNCMAP